MTTHQQKSILSLLHALLDSCVRDGNTVEADYYCDRILDMVKPGPVVIPVEMDMSIKLIQSVLSGSWWDDVDDKPSAGL